VDPVSSDHVSEYVTKNVDSEFLSSTGGTDPYYSDEAPVDSLPYIASEEVEDTMNETDDEEDSSTPSFASRPSRLSYRQDFELIFNARPFGMRVRPADKGRGVVVSSFKDKNLGKETMLEVGCRILQVNGVTVENMSYDEFIKVIQVAALPVNMQFRLPIDEIVASENLSGIMEEEYEEKGEFLEMCKVLSIFVNDDDMILELLAEQFGQKFETLKLVKQHSDRVRPDQIAEYFTTRNGEPDFQLLDQVMTALQEYEENGTFQSSREETTS